MGRKIPKHIECKLTLTWFQRHYFGLQKSIIKAALLSAPASALQVAGGPPGPSWSACDLGLTTPTAPLAALEDLWLLEGEDKSPTAQANPAPTALKDSASRSWETEFPSPVKSWVMREVTAPPQVLVGGHVPLCPLWRTLDPQPPLKPWAQAPAWSGCWGAVVLGDSELSSGHGSERGCTRGYGDGLRTSTSSVAQQEGWCNLVWAQCTDKLMTGKMPTRKKLGGTWTNDWLIKPLLKASPVDTLGSDWIYSKSSRDLHFLWQWIFYDPWIISFRCRKAFRLLPFSIILDMFMHNAFDFWLLLITHSSVNLKTLIMPLYSWLFEKVLGKAARKQKKKVMGEFLRSRH